MPKLYLIGSGPGDPDLITRKGLKILQTADVVLYDSLAPKELLDETKESCELIFAGKRGGIKSITQEEINQKILEAAKHATIIVRLKGGDPMIFGRSFEEIEWARKHGIEVEVVPGISTLNAFAASYQAPITKREEHYGFWVVSATTHLRELSEEIRIAAQSSSNILIFMGLHKLENIVEEFLKYKASDFPIGIFQNISMQNARHTIGTLADIEMKAKNGKFEAPALVVIGNVLNDIVK